ncbi:MAG: type 2 isopentenyl-diphosphate Delta-isomerase [Deltaproteobacteria bacterium]|nr:type 2 isopentenyl-diphosphate Delta-isomerase [Deltaproteobacteria bacterium]
MGTGEDEGRDAGRIANRKDEHLRLALEDQVEVPLAGTRPAGSRAERASGAASSDALGREGAWQAIRLVPRALPEIALSEVDTSVSFLGKRLAMPLIIGSMTGGTELAGELNRRLARAAARVGVGMGLGSQRVMRVRPEARATFAVRDAAPGLPLLIANFGAVQLNTPLDAGGVDADALGEIARAVDADALVLHLNAAQEAVQPEGDTDFRGLAKKIGAVARVLGDRGLPVGIKEVGQGLTTLDLGRLEDAPLAFIESAGAGGTSWTLIEGKRAEDEAGRGLGALFADWGVPAVTSLLACVEAGRGVPVIASGGMRTGLDMARALAAGASMTAMALPLLKAAAVSEDRCVEVLRELQRALATAMFLVGAGSIDALRRTPHVIDAAYRPAAWEGRAG